MKRIRQILPLLATAAFVAAAGVAPHLWFSESSGAISYFKSAYDEEFYGQGAVDATLAGEFRSRVVSGVMMRALHALTGANLELTLIASDFVWPFLCALAAGFLASALTRRTSTRILLTLLFLFGQEALSLGCTVVWSSGYLASLRGLFPPWGPTMIPDYTTSYLSLYRGPEPQISWTIEFACLGLLVRRFSFDRNDPGLSHWAALLALDLCLGFSYVFCAVPVILLQWLLAGGALVRGQARRCAGLAGSALLASLVLVAQGMPAQGAANAGVSVVFHSRLPVLTPSVVASAAFVVLLVLQYRRKILRSDQVFLSLAAGSIPMLLMNQQLLTGLMISTRDWERYSNYPLLILGFAGGVLLRPSNTKMIPHVVRTWAPALFALILAVGVGRAQKSAVDQWRPLNELVMAQQDALRNATRLSESSSLVLEDPGSAPLLQVKAGRPLRFVLFYNDLFRSPIANMPEYGGPPSGRQAHQKRLFEYFSRNGKSWEEVDQILRAEAQGRGGFYLAFLFSIMDHWYPASENRLVRQEEILRQIAPIVGAYKEYLETDEDGLKEVTVLLTTTPPERLGENPRWANEYLASGRARTNSLVRVYAYRQTKKVAPYLDRRELTHPNLLNSK